MVCVAIRIMAAALSQRVPFGLLLALLLRRFMTLSAQPMIVRCSSIIRRGA